MNVYIYDDFLNKSRHRRSLNKIEIRLTDLGLNGKIIRLGTIKNVKEVIQSEVRNGAKNIIAVGNNETVNKTINALLSNKDYDFFKKELLFSIIPIGDNNSIAESIGVKKGEEACNIMLARRVESLDVAWAGKNIFLNKAELISNEATVKINNQYNIEVNKKIDLQIVNISDRKNDYHLDKISPQDEKLNIVINKGKDNTLISSDDIKISGTGELILDSCIRESLPLEIGIIKQKINIIVGKDRNFN
jgi:hypothetical protein